MRTSDHFSIDKNIERAMHNKPLVIGAAAGIAVAAGLLAFRKTKRSRRYADRAIERRNPMSLFTPGLYLRRRAIDHSGAHPLFERRASVYEQY